MNIIRPFPIILLTASAFAPALGYAQDINAEREHWVTHSRLSEANRVESVAALRTLYQTSGDKAVRADLIALLLRGGQHADALAVCTACQPADFSSDELQNLAKAARDSQQFNVAAGLYQSLRTRFPKEKAGFLGSALVAVDTAAANDANQYIQEYRRRFGNDADIQTASEYLVNKSRSNTEHLNSLMKGLEQNPNPDRDTVLAAYRLASEMQIFPYQERLMEKYPQHFNRNDQLWLKKNEAASRLRGGLATYDQDQLKRAYNDLSEIAAETKEGSELHTSALRDRLGASSAVGKHKENIEDYRSLAKRGTQPDYVKYEYAKALSETGSPNEATKIYQELANRELVQHKHVGDELNESLIGSYADLGYFDKAREQIPNWNIKRTKLDFTRTVQIDNPYYDKQYFWNARLDAWNGDSKRAVREMDAWIADHPADPWAMVLRGELSYWNGHSEEAREWFIRAQEFLPPDSQDWVQNKIASMHLAGGNWREVSNTVQTVGRDNLNFRGFFTEYDNARAPVLSVSANAMKATFPSESTEWGQSATLYSGRNGKGHRAYVTEQTAYVPEHGDSLRTGRVGVGAEFSWYPASVSIEAGHGFQLNEKAYAKAGVGYQAGSRLSLTAAAAYNSANTPTKALSQDVYAHEYNIGGTYTVSNNFRIGAGAGLMDFDDGNLRKNAFVWVSNNLFQHNRWKLDSSLWADYSSNKDIPSAYYYNPRNSKSLSATLSLSYTQPFDNNMKLKHVGSAGAGRYWQSDVDAENTWLLKYGHEWQLGKHLSLNYDFGRRQAMYDGAAEYQNFGNLGLSYRFK